MPQYRNRMWDGKIRLFSIQTGEIYFGLLSYIEEFAKRNDIEIEYKEGVKDDEQLGDSELDTVYWKSVTSVQRKDFTGS